MLTIDRQIVDELAESLLVAHRKLCTLRGLRMMPERPSVDPRNLVLAALVTMTGDAISYSDTVHIVPPSLLDDTHAS